MSIRHSFLATTFAILVATLPARCAEPAKPVANPIAIANNEFSSDFFHEVAKKPGNVFYSPFSIEAAFGMLSAGAKGETLNQMVKTLHLPSDLEKTHVGFKEMFAKLNNDKTPADKRGFELRVANALWGSTTYPWRKEYLKVTSENYGAGLFETNFNDPESARLKINQWVEDQTKNKIKDLLPKASITIDTRMVLTNAIYFNGKWELEFDKKLTKNGPFVHANGNKKDIPLMFKQASFAYMENEKWQAVELPYVGKEASMLVS